MSDDQLMCLFDVDRDADGNAKVVAPKQAEPGPEKMFRKRCYVNGVTDQKVVDRLWREERAGREEREKAAKKKRSRQ